MEGTEGQELQSRAKLSHDGRRRVKGKGRREPAAGRGGRTRGEGASMPSGPARSGDRAGPLPGRCFGPPVPGLRALSFFLDAPPPGRTIARERWRTHALGGDSTGECAARRKVSRRRVDHAANGVGRSVERRCLPGQETGKFPPSHERGAVPEPIPPLEGSGDRLTIVAVEEVSARGDRVLAMGVLAEL